MSVWLFVTGTSSIDTSKHPRNVLTYIFALIFEMTHSIGTTRRAGERLIRATQRCKNCLLLKTPNNAGPLINTCFLSFTPH